MNGLIYFLFLCSGFSGLVYQVVWIREFGNIFGNTVYSASLVVAVFMLGLGAGSYLIGKWADRQYAARPDSLLRAYGYVELMIAALGGAISIFLPHLGSVSALVSWYVRDATGWYVLSASSYLARGMIAALLLAPITLLMGGTLTLLIRHLVRKNLQIAGTRIAVLYSVNAAGAALGCFLTDFALVPAIGLQGAQVVAAAVNIVIATAALVVAAGEPAAQVHAEKAPEVGRKRGRESFSDRDSAKKTPFRLLHPSPVLALTGVALGLSGFAAMGMEILWFRHFTLLLGGFRAVFSLLLTVILLGIGVGSLLGGLLPRRTARPALWLMAVQGCFVATALLGLTANDMPSILSAGRLLEPSSSAPSGSARAVVELWLNLAPILVEVGVPALLMGFSFPLANAVIQHAEESVGQRAGVLYLSNTVGAVCGSLAAGFLLLPVVGMQGSATILTAAAGLAIVPLYAAARARGSSGEPSRFAPRRAAAVLMASALVAGAAMVLWLRLPSTYLIARAQVPPVKGERLLTLSEGVNEVIAISEVPDEGRQLLTNGHPMSSTNRMSRRYMRGLAHIPLLSLDHPADTVLVIGFGVGETLQAATLHPSVRRVEIADLSTGILRHAGYFRDTNQDVLKDPKVVVYVNDGRQHLRMQPEGTYDAIMLEPPPIAHAGVGALYSEEFYTLARTRLKPRGYFSQWLPAYQVPAETTLAMVRAFLNVFPQAVLLSGADAELLLVGTNDSRIEIDPARVAATLTAIPAVRLDLGRLDLGSVRELVGTFVGGPQTLDEATRNVPPVTDDRPLQEYGARSRLSAPRSGVPAPLVNLSQVATWCPKCFVEGSPVPIAEGLDGYLALLDSSYKGTPPPRDGPGSLANQRIRRMIQQSAYLGTVLNDVHNQLGAALAAEGRFDEAIGEFREGLRLEPDSAALHRNLGHALAATHALEGAIDQLRQAARLDPGDVQALSDLASTLAQAGQYAAAAEEFRAAARLKPASSELHNNLGMALVSQAKLDEAIPEFQQALRLRPDFADARRNLTMALQAQREVKSAP